MKKMQSIFLVIAVLVFNFSARADVIDWMRENIPADWHDGIHRTSVLRYLLEKGECAETPKPLPEMSAEDLESRAKKSFESKDYCEAARGYFELMRQHPVRPYYKNGWIEMIRSLLLAEDTTGVINEANDFMVQMRGVAEEEDAHFMLLSAVHMKVVRATDENTQDWVYIALGLSRAQLKDNQYLSNMSYKSYLDAFPKGKYLDQVNAWIAEARAQSCRYFLKIGQFYSFHGNYYSALLRYKYVLRYGISMPVFPEAMYETVVALVQFSKQIQDESVVEEVDLRAWMRLDPKQGLNRAGIAQDIYKQAQQVVRAMQDNLAKSEWTAKAQNFLQGGEH